MHTNKRVVLVIEDDDVIRTLVGDVLEEHGWHVRRTRHGAEALQVLDTVRPDVIVLDLLMPVMHGWAFMEEYARKTDGVAIPIVVLSVNPILPRSFDKFGVFRCIGKPFQVDDLVKAVEDAVSASFLI
jgi:two-component system, chemotaxis family, chemotaxis protein CheY